MPRVIWSGAAVSDLSDIRHWLLSEAGPAVTRRLLRKIRAAAAPLTSFPGLGPGLAAHERKLRVRATPYVIVYRISPEQVEVLRVRHSRQDWRPV